MSRINQKYTKEIKLAVVKKYLEGNGGYSTVAKEMNIRNDSQVYSWVKKYLQFGETAFDHETRGSKKGPHKGRPKTNFQTIEEEVKYLRMQNEYLKKLHAQQQGKE